MSGHPTAHGTEAHQPVFTGKALERLEALFPKYPNKQACLLPALWIIQEERGWISPQAMAEVGERLGLTPAYVKGVVTFYTMYHQHPVGRHFIQVCTTSMASACWSLVNAASGTPTGSSGCT